jgi:hypothetical protein
MIDRKLQGRILEALVEITKNPTEVRGDTVKPLTGDLKGFWRYRVGDYRIAIAWQLDIGGNVDLIDGDLFRATCLIRDGDNSELPASRSDLAFTLARQRELDRFDKEFNVSKQLTENGSPRVAAIQLLELCAQNR